MELYQKKSPGPSIPVMDDMFPTEVHMAIVSRRKAVKKQQDEKERKEWQ